MKSIRYISFCLVAALTSLSASAQDVYSVEIKNDLKILNVHNMGLAPSTPVMQVLIAMPELLVRPGESAFENYDIMIDGVSLGVSTDETLSNTRLFDIDKIEISESAVSSYLSNGQGGSINIIMKKPEDGISGRANVTAYTLPDAQASVQANYSKNKLLMRGWISMEYYDPTESVVETTASQLYSSKIGDGITTSDTTGTQYGHEMARIYMKYVPSGKDELEFNLAESLKLQAKDIGKTSNDVDLFDLKTNIGWNHKIDSRSGIRINSEFDGNSGGDLYDNGSTYLQNTDVQSNQIAGKAEYWRQMLKESSPNSIKLSAGSNINWSNQLEHNVLTTSKHSLGLPNQDYTTDGTSFFVSPYLITESQFGKWHIKTSLEYQYYKYTVSSSLGDNFDKPRHDITGKVMVGWQFADHQNIRLLFDRKLKRPSYSQLYPYKLYNTSALKYFVGNANLIPVMINEVGADYITDFALGNGFFIINAGLHFIHAEGNLNTAKGNPEYFTSSLSVPNPFIYYTYVNAGSSDILNTELMVLYQLGRFNLSVTGNLYDSIKTDGESDDFYSYFNWSVHPGFHLNHGWNVSLKTIFNSKIETTAQVLGRYSYSYLNLDKEWNRLTLSLHALVPFTRTVTDIAYNNMTATYSVYKPIKEYAAISISYRF